MRAYIETHLRASPKWQSLAASDPTCEDIINEISARAAGVWLWVSLVTDDIVKEAEKSEGAATLRKIVNEFPGDLHGYFERIIKEFRKFTVKKWPKHFSLS